MRAVLTGMIVFSLVRLPAIACSARSYQPDEILTNEPVYSANGRYAVIERWYEGLEDFKSARAGTLLGLDEPERERSSGKRETLTFAMYESSTQRRIAEFSIPFDDDGNVLVADSGRYAAVVRPLYYGCYGQPEPGNAVVTIFRSDGTRVGRLQVSDVLTPSDVALSRYERLMSFSSALRHESDTREVLVLSIEGHERRIDLATASLLDLKENLLPAPTVVADAESRTRNFSAEPFDEAGAIHLESKELLARAVDEPLPEYPEVARKAHVAGTVWVQVVVSEYGDVVTVRSTSLPFGLTQAATTAVRGWRFRPLSVEGKRVKFTGEVAIHFTHAVPR